MLLAARVRALAFIAALNFANCFLFGGSSRRDQVLKASAHSQNAHHVDLGSPSRLTNTYAVALGELEDLESEPLCHRIAARLLVNNCQLLDGKDDATILTDSGRKIRDFVDSYAASLAICDLERGSFEIPTECAKFREHTLAELPVPTSPRLHVSSRQVDVCLAALGRSDSAWNTWVSYRHKALRFCEAARADHEKTETILLYQRLTKILGSLANGVERDIEEQFRAARQRAADVGREFDQIFPRVQELRHDLGGLEDMISSKIHAHVERSAASILKSTEHAANLQRMLDVLFQSMLRQNSEAAAAYDIAVDTAAERVNEKMVVVMAALATTVATTMSLQEQMDFSLVQSSTMQEHQAALEKNIERLSDLATDVNQKLGQHEHRLHQAHEKADAVLGTLEAAAESADNFRSFLSPTWLLHTIWPYVLCPVAFLVLGSYGIPKSALRNLALVAVGQLYWRHGRESLLADEGLGEAAGFVVSASNSYAAGLASVLWRDRGMGATNTSSTSPPLRPDTCFFEIPPFSQNFGTAAQ